MKSTHGIAVLAATCLWLTASTAAAQDKQDDLIFKAMEAEMARSMAELNLEDAGGPYRVAYTVIDIDVSVVTATGGALTVTEQEFWRRLKADVRVGSYEKDNTNTFFFGGFGRRGAAPPLDDDVGVLRRSLWLMSDQAYKDSIQAMVQKEAYLREHPSAEEPRPDYTKVGPHVIVEPTMDPTFDIKAAEDTVRQLSEAFNAHDFIEHDGTAMLVAKVRRRYLDTEGNRADTSLVLSRVAMAASAFNKDGVEVFATESFIARDGDSLPSPKALLASAEGAIERLKALREAPVVEDYDGPVLFEGEAAGQLMRFFLARNLSGTPEPLSPGSMAPPGRDFLRKMDRPVLPKGWTVYDDPAQKDFKGTTLLGHYSVDHEGVPAQKVELIKDGRLKATFMTRVPSSKQKESNGHARGPLMGRLMGHPGNLFIQAPKGQSPAAMKKKLLSMANDEGYDYAIIVRRFVDEAINMTGSRGSFSQMMPSRSGMPAPLLVYRVNKDGSEELLRGVTFNHVIVRNLREITVTSRQPVVYNYLSPGVTNAGGFAMGLDPTGWVPTTIVTPSFILPHVEVVPNKGERRRAPMVPPPSAAKAQ